MLKKIINLHQARSSRREEHEKCYSNRCCSIDRVHGWFPTGIGSVQKPNTQARAFCRACGSRLSLWLLNQQWQLVRAFI